MKIRVVKLALEGAGNRVLNADLTEYLNVGAEFFVYGIRIFDGVIYTSLFARDHLFEAPLELFEIIEGRTPSFWIITSDRDNGLALWPKLFYQEFFFENFAERDAKARIEFEDLRFSIENGIL